MAAFAVALDERHENFGAVDHALQIDVDDPVPVALAQASELAADRDAGIVAHDMYLAESRERFECRALHRAALRHIALNGQCLDLFFGKPFGGTPGRTRI